MGTIASGKLNLAISGITLLTFMCIHLFQFRFGETQMFKLCPPPYLVNIGTIFHLRLNLFWVDTPGCATADVRDIYRMEFEVFQSLGWDLHHAHVPWMAEGGAGTCPGHSEAIPF